MPFLSSSAVSGKDSVFLILDGEKNEVMRRLLQGDTLYRVTLDRFPLHYYSSRKTPKQWNETRRPLMADGCTDQQVTAPVGTP